MGLAEIFWRVTLTGGLGGSDPDAVFLLEYSDIPMGQKKPDTMFYAEIEPGLSLRELAVAVPCVGYKVSQKASELTLQNPQMEYHFSRHMNI